jgi:hypothetical protein
VNSITKIDTTRVDLPASTYPGAAQMTALLDRALERLAASPGVEAAGGVNWRSFGDMIVAGDFAGDGGSRGKIARKSRERAAAGAILNSSTLVATLTASPRRASCVMPSIVLKSA